MGRTMSDEQEREDRQFVANMPNWAHDHGDEYQQACARAHAELDAERDAYELERASVKTCAACGEVTSTLRGHLMAEELAALKARLACAGGMAAALERIAGRGCIRLNDTAGHSDVYDAHAANVNEAAEALALWMAAK